MPASGAGTGHASPASSSKSHEICCLHPQAERKVTYSDPWGPKDKPIKIPKVAAQGRISSTMALIHRRSFSAAAPATSVPSQVRGHYHAMSDDLQALRVLFSCTPKGCEWATTIQIWHRNWCMYIPKHQQSYHTVQVHHKYRSGCGQCAQVTFR